MPGPELERCLTCIVCPNERRLVVRGEGEALCVEGNLCPKGERFAREELACPMRTLTTTVRIRGAALPVLPVRTDGEIPKEKLFDAMAQLADAQAQAPVRCGQVVLEDVAGTGVAVIATCDMA